MNRELTKREQEVAATLKAVWLARKAKDKSFSQEKLAERLDISQGAVSHYLNGQRPFGLEALVKFCTILGADVMDVYPELVSKHGAENVTQVTEFINLFLNADEGVKKGVLSILRSSSSQ